MALDRIALNIFPVNNFVYESASLGDSVICDDTVVIGSCPWFANSDLLFKGDYFCGLSWPITEGYVLTVAGWVNGIGSKFLRIVPRSRNESFYSYYSSEKIHYFLQLLWIDSEPDGAMLAGLCEDHWLYRPDNDNSIDGVVAICLEGVGSIALDYGLLLPIKETDELNENSITFSASMSFFPS
jgi:hypothetical protein